jgi:hypothetical protein
MESLDKQEMLRKLDMKFSTWNVKDLYRASTVMTFANELSKYFRFSRNRRDETEEATNQQENTHFSMEREITNQLQLGLCPVAVLHKQ